LVGNKKHRTEGWVDGVVGVLGRGRQRRGQAEGFGDMERHI
jgi:hypothetical protein